MKKKMCVACSIEKPVAQFSKNTVMPDGLHFYCRQCNSARNADQRNSCRARLAEARDIKKFLASATAALAENRWTRIDLARALKVKPSTVYDWFSGKKQPHPRTQLHACDILGLQCRRDALEPNKKGQYPDGMGECDSCGKQFPTFAKSFNKHCSRECANRAQSTRQFGELNHAYKDGRKLTDQGYVQVLIGRDNPVAGRGGYALEHRLVMSRHIGRPLKRSEVVHHINGDRTDNRLENLELCAKDEIKHPPGQRVSDLALEVMRRPEIEALDDGAQDLVWRALIAVFGVPHHLRPCGSGCLD